MAAKIWEQRDYCRQIGIQPGLVKAYNTYKAVTTTAEDKFLYQSTLGAEQNISFMGMEACFRDYGYAEFILTTTADVYITTVARLEGGDGKTIVMERPFFPPCTFEMVASTYFKVRTVGADFTVSYLVIAFQAADSM